MTDDNVIFNSDFNYQKIALSASRVNTVPPYAGSPTVVTIPHNLGYAPSVRVWYDPGNGRRYIAGNLWFLDSNGTGTDWSSGVNVAYVYVTSSNLVVAYANFSGSNRSVTTYYRIYQE